MTARRRWLPLYVSEYRDRHGKPRWRFRRKGFATHHFVSPPGSEAFRAEYRACLEQAPAEGGGATRAAPGSIAELIVRFYASPAWRGRMKPSSQRTYRSIIERFRAAHGDKPVAMVQTRHLDAILGKLAATPAAANNLRKVMKRLFGYAVKIGLRPDNPALATDGYRTNAEGWHTWTEEEIARFEAYWPLGSRPRLALALMLYTGQRRGDAILLGRQHLRDGRIRLRQGKTGESLAIPVHSALAAAIAAMPESDHLTYLVTNFGRPFTSAGFGNWFRKRCDEAGLTGCSAHGLRKAMSRRLAELGATNLEGRAITGHKTDRMFAHYAERADQGRLADAAMANLETGFATKKE
ncbi:MAG: tyrosine-type recombinase/integrase [Sphingomonas sp.]